MLIISHGTSGPQIQQWLRNRLLIDMQLTQHEKVNDRYRKSHGIQITAAAAVKICVRPTDSQPVSAPDLVSRLVDPLFCLLHCTLQAESSNREKPL